MVEIIQERHGRLSLISILDDRSADNHKVGRWLCECGTTADVALTRVRNGNTASCGCLAREVASEAHTKHGMHGTPEYRSWVSMIRRCHSVVDKDFPRYGAKGIVVCEEWRSSFDAFYSHIGPRPNGTTVDRINGNLGYHPGNVRWATPLQQARNRRDLTVVSTPRGTMPLVDYASLIGISKGAAHLRLKRGKLEGVSHV